MATTAVYQMLQGSGLSITERSQSGTRTYTDAPKPPSVISTIQLPEIGDEWSNDYPECLCRQIDVYPLNELCDTYSKYVLSYATKEEDAFNQNQSEEDLPINIEIGTELIAWDTSGTTGNGSNDFVWVAPDGQTYSNNGKKIKQTIWKRINLVTYTFTRRVNSLTAFKQNVNLCVGKINSGYFYGVPPQMLLFEGTSVSSYTDLNGSKSWMVSLTFKQRMVNPSLSLDPSGAFKNNGTNVVDGWNFVLNEVDGLFYRPYLAKKPGYLYDTADFKGLITSGYGIFNPHTTALGNPRTFTR